MQTIYRIATIVLILISCLVIGVFYVVTTRNIEAVYASDTESAIYTLKQDFLRDTVNNQIKRIDKRRELETGRYRQILNKTEDTLNSVFSSSSEEAFIQFFTNHFTLRSSADMWTAVLWEPASGKILLDTNDMIQNGITLSEVIMGEVEHFAVYTSATYGRFEAFYGVQMEKIDTVVKHTITEEIHSSTFAEDSYLWVNEVLDYGGCENYAIRRIHPNLRDSEGMYLSTSMTDIAGNHPYLEELEGVKEDGEIFFTYFFKRKNSDEIAEKLTYAKLYEDFDWIVAMGIHLADMDAYVDSTNRASAEVTRGLFPIFLVVLILLVSGGSGAIIFLERWKIRRARRALEEEANHDVLTHAFNRRMGLTDLLRMFRQFTKNRDTNPAIIIFDIDNFKQVNDTFGHAEGDMVLQLVAKFFVSSIRNTDRLYRWGGDEFLIVCDGVKADSVKEFCDNLLSRFAEMIEDTEFPRINLTISMGVSYFHADDTSYQEVLARADEALYRAKRNGKNRVELSL